MTWYAFLYLSEFCFLWMSHQFVADMTQLGLIHKVYHLTVSSHGSLFLQVCCSGACTIAQTSQFQV
jgi:hypothetical protein